METIEKRLEDELVKLILQGVVYFAAGGALGFDTLAAMTVLRLRDRYPQIRLILVLPCAGQTRGWKDADVRKYEWIKSRANKVTVLSVAYYRGCMHARNRYLIDHSAYCVCYLRKAEGGTAYTVACAEKQGLKVIRI